MIRPAILSDIHSLLEIEKWSFKPEDRFNRKQFLYAINKGKGFILVDFQFHTYQRGYIYMLANGHIYSLAVHPTFRNKNIATGLLKAAENLCTDKVTLEVRKDNRAAHCFYIKNGYKYVKTKHNYYSDGMDAIVMQKDLLNA